MIIKKTVHIQVPSGKTIDLDGKGNMDVNVPEKFTLKCKNMNIEVEENSASDIGQDMIVSIGNNQTTTVGEAISNTTNSLAESIAEKADVTIGEKLTLITDKTDMFANGGDFVVKSAGKALVQGEKDARISRG